MQKTDIGVLFKVVIKDQDEVVVNLSDATVKQFLFSKPNHTVLTVDTGYFTDGVDGILTYVTGSGDLDVAGIWRLQAYIEKTNGKFFSTKAIFKVDDNVI